MVGARFHVVNCQETVHVIEDSKFVKALKDFVAGSVGRFLQVSKALRLVASFARRWSTLWIQ
jgi:hypothetical protein